MELPKELFDQVSHEGNIYYFTSQCPFGIPEHMHICIRHHDRMLLFSTCTSQIDTIYRFAFRGNDPNTYPCFKKNNINKFDRPLTFVNCNQVIECSVSDFQGYIEAGFVRPLDGVLTDSEMADIARGVQLSPWVSRDIKKLFSSK